MKISASLRVCKGNMSARNTSSVYTCVCVCLCDCCSSYCFLLDKVVPQLSRWIFWVTSTTRIGRTPNQIMSKVLQSLL